MYNIALIAIMSTEVVKAQNALNSISSGKAINNDEFVHMWANTNWGELLQPAPLSISVIGSILVLAASTDDFSLVTERRVDDWKFAKYPESFKTSLEQVVGDSFEAFSTAHAEMENIQNASAQMPGEIRTAVMTILKASPKEVEVYLPGQLEGVRTLAEICSKSALRCETGFNNLTGLLQELILACSNKRGDSEQKKGKMKLELQVLKTQLKHQKQRLENTERTHETMQKAFVEAEEGFKRAADSIPTGWGAVGMQVVEAYVDMAKTATSVAANCAVNVPLHVMGMVQGGAKIETRSSGASPSVTAARSGATANSTAMSAASTSDDESLASLSTISAYIATIKGLLDGGEDGKPEFERIRSDQVANGGAWVEAGLNVQIKSISSRTNHPWTSRIHPIVTESLDIIVNMRKAAGSLQGHSASSEELKKTYLSRALQVEQDLEKLKAERNLILQQSSISAHGPATPVPGQRMSDAAASRSLEAARIKVDETRAHLVGSREAFERSSIRLEEGQKEVGRTVVSMTTLKLESMTLEQMIPILVKAVQSFKTLRTQFSQITQFFNSITSLINVVLVPSVARWVKTMEDARSLGGVSISDFTRQLIYTQMMMPLKISMLAEKISATYMTVSTKYIMPSLREVGQIQSSSAGVSKEERRAYIGKLTRVKDKVGQQAIQSSKEILQLVANEQKQFVSSIDERLNVIMTAVKPVLAIEDEIPGRFVEVTYAHVKCVDEAKGKEMSENGIYKKFDVNSDDIM